MFIFSMSFTDIELKVGLVVAENDFQHSFKRYAMNIFA